MASVKDLKRDINELTYHLLAKCYALKSYEQETKDERFDEMIKKIVYLRNDLIRRANHPENDAESKSMKEHYLKIKLDLYELMKSFDELKEKID